MKSNLLKHNGFSLVELITVIVIIGVIAAFALPMYQSYMEKANLAEAKQQIAAIYQRVQNEKVANTKKLTDKASYQAFLGAALPANKGEKYHFTYDVLANGKIMNIYFLAFPINQDYKYYVWANADGTVFKCKSSQAFKQRAIHTSTPNNCETF